MARMRAHNRELSAKDAVWQTQLAAAAAVAAAVSPPAVPSLPEAALSPVPTSPPLCASPVSPGEMSVAFPSLRGAVHKVAPRPKRGSGKIRRKRLTKEEEARFPASQLADLTGTTAARSRKMTPEEHDLMLHKRRLRNRESAARSRDRQRRTTAELAAEIDELNERSRALAAACERAGTAARHHAARAEQLERTNQALMAELAALRANSGATIPPPTSRPSVALPTSAALAAPANMVTTSAGLSNASAGLSTASLGLSTVPAMSSDTLDRLLGSEPLPPMPRATSMLRMPSWASLRTVDPSTVPPPPPPPPPAMRKPDSLLGFMDLNASNSSLSQDMSSLLPASAAPL